MLQVTFCFLLVCLGTEAYDLKFDYQISEENARFVENVETNLGKNIVKYHTPAHNDIMESYKMQDFKQGKQITCLPSLRQCRLRDIDLETAVDAGRVTESFVHSWNNGVNSISSAESTKIEELYYITDDEVVDTMDLGNELTQFYDSFGYPLYQEKKVPMNAEILNITQSTRNRFKRSTMLFSNCNGIPKIVYGVLQQGTCNYVKICKNIVEDDHGVRRFMDCGNIHIFSPTAYMCFCCPSVTEITVDMLDENEVCECTRMKRN